MFKYDVSEGGDKMVLQLLNFVDRAPVIGVQFKKVHVILDCYTLI